MFPHKVPRSAEKPQRRGGESADGLDPRMQALLDLLGNMNFKNRLITKRRNDQKKLVLCPYTCNSECLICSTQATDDDVADEKSDVQIATQEADAGGEDGADSLAVFIVSFLGDYSLRSLKVPAQNPPPCKQRRCFVSTSDITPLFKNNYNYNSQLKASKSAVPATATARKLRRNLFPSLGSNRKHGESSTPRRTARSYDSSTVGSTT